MLRQLQKKTNYVRQTALQPFYGSNAQIQNKSLIFADQSFNLHTYSKIFTQPITQMSLVSNFGQMRNFSTDNKKPPSDDPAPKKRKRSVKSIEPAEKPIQKLSAGEQEQSQVKPVVKRTRKQKNIETQAEEIDATNTDVGPLRKMYVMKFNSPILPFAKFPLTHNKYIQDFLAMYETDKEKITDVIGVHFPQNNNSLAKDTVGIEIKITKKNNLTTIESFNTKRFRVNDYDSTSNFCMAQEFKDLTLQQTFGKSKQGVELNPKDLLASELFELKNLWFVYNKKINGLLMILPTEVLNRYDLVVKSLNAPIFDVHKYGPDQKFEEIFDECVYKMGQFYFAVFQALFSKDNEAMRPMISSFLAAKDPMHRSRKLINLYEEMHGIIDKKMFYVHKTAEEFKERSKTSLLEHAYQKVLEDNKKSEKTKYQEKLDAVKNMPDSVRKVLQEEINGLDSKNDMEASRKINYLTQVFRLPWDGRVDPFWDVQYSQKVLEASHYGMSETKERILEFIAKNKRINSQKGMVLLLTGPPGVGKTSIAKSIGECLKRPTTIISMGGQNDPMHIKGSKRTYVDSQPGIFVKELQRLECKNPVIVIDEIDKVGFNSMKGDVSSTLLELLNPEQSNQFRDSFLDLEFDFSEVIYICTSNSIANMLAPLLDRIEVIHVPAYLPIEKLNIAKNYLMPNLEKEYGFLRSQQTQASPSIATELQVEKNEKVELTDAAIMEIITHYCGHEAGVRNLKKAIDRVFRKIVAKIENQPAIAQSVDLESATNYQVNSKNLEKFLDFPTTDDNFYQNINKELPVGSANGLAYVNDGYGAVLKIQFIKKLYGNNRPDKPVDEKESEKSSGTFTHTGRLGEVFAESTQVVKLAAFNFLEEFGICKNFDKDSYHLHVPMGATPKDGPSAGVSLFASLVSAALNRPVAQNLAMTGEITTLGEVISIGGVREKLTACKNHNITRVILPLSNKKNVSKLPEEFKKGFTIFYVTNIKQLYEVCFPSEDNAQEDYQKVFYDKLKKMDIEIDEFESDNFHKVVFEDERIEKSNQIEQLF